MIILPKDILASSKNHIICILIDNMYRYEYFKKLIKKYKPKKIVFLHSGYFTYINFKSDDGIHILLTSTNKNNTKSLDNKKSIQEKLETRNKSFFDNRYSKESLEVIVDKYDINQLWIFNGYQYSWYRLKETLSKETRKNIDILYFEISNYPDKIQCGIDGINADNKSLGYVTKFSEKFDETKYKYLFEKIINYKPKNPKINIQTKLKEYFYMQYGFRIKNTLAFPSRPNYVLKKLIDSFFVKKLLKNYSRNKISKDKYILFIGQVNDDSQILFQSNETILSGLKKAHNITKDSGYDLVIRFHPRENNLKATKEIIEYCKENNILINNYGSLYDAALDAQTVITINSTGGSHMILADKKVITLGRSFYSNWSKNDVLTYYYKFLID